MDRKRRWYTKTCSTLLKQAVGLAEDKRVIELTSGANVIDTLCKMREVAELSDLGALTS